MCTKIVPYMDRNIISMWINKVLKFWHLCIIWIDCWTINCTKWHEVVTFKKKKKKLFVYTCLHSVDSQYVVVYVLCACVCVQLLVKDLEQMLSRQSLEVHALLVWRHYVNLLGMVGHCSIVTVFCYVHAVSPSSLLTALSHWYILSWAVSRKLWNDNDGNDNSVLVWLTATTVVQFSRE